VLTVVIAILVSSSVGASPLAKILATVISAVVLVAIEWFVRWSPSRLQWARTLFDVRAMWTGIWVQSITLAWTTTGRLSEARNSFSVFRIGYDDGYYLNGRAYDSDGQDVAEWHSDGDPTFTKDGRSMSYVWRGNALDSGNLDSRRIFRESLRIVLLMWLGIFPRFFQPRSSSNRSGNDVARSRRCEQG
jgi:hypothetical protein